MPSSFTKFNAVCLYKGERTVLKGTTERNTKTALIRLVVDNGKALLAKLDDADLDQEWSYKAGIMKMGDAQFFLVASSCL